MEKPYDVRKVNGHAKKSNEIYKKGKKGGKKSVRMELGDEEVT